MLLENWQRDQIRHVQDKYMSDLAVIQRERLGNFNSDTGEHELDVEEVWEGHCRVMSTEREPRRADAAEEQQFVARFIITLPYYVEAQVGDKVYFKESPYKHIEGSTMVITAERPSSYGTVRRVFAEWPRSVGGAY